MSKKNVVTGERYPVNSPVGHNWTIYYCLLYKLTPNMPLDNVMILINEFLNWIPAGCWKYRNLNHCIYCNDLIQFSKNRNWFYNVIVNNYPIGYCSYYCVEKHTRNNIINNYYDIFDKIELEFNSILFSKYETPIDDCSLFYYEDKYLASKNKYENNEYEYYDENNYENYLTDDD